MSSQWTRDSELGLSEAKNNRKALFLVVKKFSQTIARLPALIARGQWRNFGNAPLLTMHKVRLERMILVSFSLPLCSPFLFFHRLICRIHHRIGAVSLAIEWNESNFRVLLSLM